MKFETGLVCLEMVPQPDPTLPGARWGYYMFLTLGLALKLSSEGV